MASNENLFHKLLGLPEDVTEPTYFELLELEEGDVAGPQVEEKYKTQIQKVQRYTNNPKYKEGALFLKGELRKARGALVDEGRRAAYMRDLLHARTQSMRGSVKPLLIKGYVLDEEYKYLSGEASKMRVPESVVQQVLKQELEKLGIDPTTALVEGDGGGAGMRSKSVVASHPSKHKKGSHMTLTARFPWLRYIFEPSELFTMDTLMAIVTFPLWLVGVKKSPARPGQPVAGGLVFHSPFVASLLIMGGVGAMVLPYSDTDLLSQKADNTFLRERNDTLEQQAADLLEEKEDLERQVKRLKASRDSGDTGSTNGNGSGGASSAEVEQLKQQIALLTAERDKAVEAAEKANEALKEAKGALAGANANIRNLTEILKSSGGLELSKLKADLTQAKDDLAKKDADIVRLEKANQELTDAAAKAAGDQKGVAAQLVAVDAKLRDLSKLLTRGKKVDANERLLHGVVIGSGAGESTCTVRFSRLDTLKEGDRFTLVRVVSVGTIQLGKPRAGKDTVTCDLVNSMPNMQPRARDIAWRIEAKAGN